MDNPFLAGFVEPSHDFELGAEYTIDSTSNGSGLGGGPRDHHERGVVHALDGFNVVLLDSQRVLSYIPLQCIVASERC